MGGRRSGPYELEELLGRGGMGEVWLGALDTRKARTVALKLLPGELTGDEGIEEWFRREAQVAARPQRPARNPYPRLRRAATDVSTSTCGSWKAIDLAKTLRAHWRAAARLEQSSHLRARSRTHSTQRTDDGLVHRDV